MINTGEGGRGDGGGVFAEFCAAGLWPGLGRTLAEALPGAGITGPDQVSAEALKKVPGVGPVRAERLLSGWIAAGGAYEVAELLAGAGLAVRLADRLTDLLGSDSTARTLRDDPWRILVLPDVSVADADRFAIEVLRGIGASVDRSDPRRGRALAGYVVGQAARDGHTAVPVDDVAAALAGHGVPDVPAAVAAACRSSRSDGGGLVAATVGGESVLAAERYALAEERTAEALGRLVDAAKPIVESGDAAAHDTDSDLDQTQLRAARLALEHGVSVLTGGPGTGKSRTVAAVVRLAEAAGREVALAAPTGRAAKRLEELVDAPASTLHRLLGAQGGRDRAIGPYGGTQFSRGPAFPLEADLVVVDETSMLDAELAAALLSACADGTHVLLVGDPAQLPSIGPGRVLADLIESGTVPVTELSTLYRQAEGGAIASLATAVRGGDLPPVDSPDREVVIVVASGSAEAGHRVVQLVTDSIPRALGIPPAQVQVVTPVHRGPAGTVALNAALKAALNPGKGTVRGFDVGDRVVATANHLDAEPTGFANGEVGVVVEARNRTVTVEFASGRADVRGKALADIVHGFAITVHRAQGSEWPAVVVAVPPEAGGMLSRPLVYTAFTRAQRHLSVVPAVGPALGHAVRRIGARPRRTRLRELLTDALPE